jgi:hypothetical protein
MANAAGGPITLSERSCRRKMRKKSILLEGETQRKGERKKE